MVTAMTASADRSNATSLRRAVTFHENVYMGILSMTVDSPHS